VSSGVQPVAPSLPNWDRLRQEPDEVAIGIETTTRIVEGAGERVEPVGALRPRLDTLAERIAARDVDGTTAAAQALAGLGPGLTPLGDDILVGALHALWAVEADGELRDSLCGAILEGSAGRTTTLSTSWIRAAARGEAGRDWLPLLAALPTCSTKCTEAATIRVLSTGHSSGAASLVGFLVTWRAVGARSSVVSHQSPPPAPK